MDTKLILSKLPIYSGFALFDPKGEIAQQQFWLFISAISLLLFVAIPIIFLAFFFAWKYRAQSGAKYTPNVDRNKPLQALWLGILLCTILVLAVMAYKSSHALDPRKPIESPNEPITIQAVSLQWKWLFIYPDENIATVNYLQFPTNTPLVFEITADSPMNALWIPQLGGQMYAMNGMSTKLHLIANETGSFRGYSSNISGEGFAGMNFKAHATTEAEYEQWLDKARSSQKFLTWEDYLELSEPSKNHEPTLYAFASGDLFGRILSQFMPDMGQLTESSH